MDYLDKYINENVINYLINDFNHNYIKFINQIIDKFNLNIQRNNELYIDYINNLEINKALSLSIKENNQLIFKYLLVNFIFDIKTCVNKIIEHDNLELIKIVMDIKKLSKYIIIEYMNITTLDTYIKCKNILNLDNDYILHINKYIDNYNIFKYIIDNRTSDLSQYHLNAYLNKAMKVNNKYVILYLLNKGAIYHYR